MFFLSSDFDKCDLAEEFAENLDQSIVGKEYWYLHCRALKVEFVTNLKLVMLCVT